MTDPSEKLPEQKKDLFNESGLPHPVETKPAGVSPENIPSQAAGGLGVAEKPHLDHLEAEKIGEKIPFLDKILEKALFFKRKEQVKPSATASAVVVTPVRDEISIKIEKVMSEGLEEAYKKMNPKDQERFRVSGEETAGLIRQLMKSAKYKISKIIKLLVKWLKLIPGVNKFFVLQEAKIKADRIDSIRRETLNK